VIADNHSSDDSLAPLRRIIASDPEVIGITNAANYRPEASVVNALRHARDCDLVMLCSAPICRSRRRSPASGMVCALLERPELDAVLAVKKRSA